MGKCACFEGTVAARRDLEYDREGLPQELRYLQTIDSRITRVSKVIESRRTITDFFQSPSFQKVKTPLCLMANHRWPIHLMSLRRVCSTYVGCCRRVSCVSLGGMRAKKNRV